MLFSIISETEFPPHVHAGWSATPSSVHTCLHRHGLGGLRCTDAMQAAAVDAAAVGKADAPGLSIQATGLQQKKTNRLLSWC